MVSERCGVLVLKLTKTNLRHFCPSKPDPMYALLPPENTMGCIQFILHQ